MEEVSSPRRRHGVAALVALATLALGGPVFAQPASKVDEAKAHFKTGAELYDENNFRGALVEFQRAYELAPSYRILYNIGQVDMELADYAGALTAYKRYLREGGPDVPAERVKEVNAEIQRLTGRVGLITVQTAAGAEVLVDDLSVGYAPLPEPVTVNTGRHKVTVHPSGQPAVDRVVDIAGEQQLTVALANELPAPAVAARAAEPPAGPPKPPSKVPAVIAVVATAAFAATAGTFAYLAHDDQDNLSKLRDSFPVTKAELSAEESKEVRSAALCDGFTAAAVVSAGLSLYLVLRHHPSTSERIGVAVSPTGAVAIAHF
jgi:tetratricopeptide (TPR) repeat protein